VPIKVLYLHPVGSYGGASRSLVEMMQNFPPASVECVVLTQRGSAAGAFAAAGARVLTCSGLSQFVNTEFNFYRGRRWLLLLRELAYFPATVWGLVRGRSEYRDAELIHANEITALPAALLAKWLFRAPLVVHVRSVQRKGDTRRNHAIRRLLTRYANAVITIDETVRESLPAGLPCQVIHNGYSPPPDVHRTYEPREVIRVAMVGNALRFKGVMEFLEAARICASDKLSVEFLMVGITLGRKDNWLRRMIRRSGLAHDVAVDVKQFIDKHRLGNYVRVLPFTADIAGVYRDVDLVCFPSHLDAIGRPVYEAAFFGIPSIVAITRPSSDTFVPGETGIAVPPADPIALAAAIRHFSSKPSDLKRMGAAARSLALRNFDSKANAAKLLKLYVELTARAP
jgi:glycosyltransferase involved in cell wall biosynthesis